MTKKTKKLLLMLSVMSMLTAGVALGGCGGETPQGPGPSFLKGIDKEIELGDGIDVGDYIDYVTDGEYTIIVTKGDYSADITKKRYWQPEEPGIYTITYTVKGGEFEGVNSFELNVYAPKMTWKYTLVNHIFDVGETMDFDDYFEGMNIAANSYYPWKMVMDSVKVGDEIINLEGENSWTYAEAVAHTFSFHIESEDGQRHSLSQAINVRYADREMLAWMDANDITVDRALRLETSGKVVLDGGTHQGNNTQNPDNVNKRSLPHLDFNGEYGINDFLVFDFTGDNLPTMLFFGDEITESPWYDATASESQNKGFLIGSGWTTKTGLPVAAWMGTTASGTGSINRRLTVYGPTKAWKMSDTGAGTLREDFSVNPNPASMYTLYQQQNANMKYRVFVGFTEASETEFTVSFYLMNRETGASVYEETKTISNTRLVVEKTLDGKSIMNTDGAVTFAEKAFKGSIALYSMFGRSVTLDKIYAIEQDTTLEKLKLKYFEAPYAWMKDNVVTTYNVKYVDETQKVVLEGSTHNGNETQGPDNLRIRDMSYVAFNGEYGLNDFVVFDFTGNNMPIVSFFNGQVTNTVYHTDGMTEKQNKGIVFMNGATNKLGDPNIGSYHKAGGINDRFMMYGPNKTYKTGSDADGFFRENISGDGAPIGLYALTQAANTNKRYRVILGFTAGSTTGCTVALCVIDLDTGTVYEKQKTVTRTFAENYFTGSIALYSHFGIETTLDKLYLIEEDTTMSALKAKYAVNA